MAENKVSSAVSKLEEDGLTVPACKKFIKMYSKVSIFYIKNNFLAYIIFWYH